MHQYFNLKQKYNMVEKMVKISKEDKIASTNAHTKISYNSTN